LDNSAAAGFSSTLHTQQGCCADYDYILHKVLEKKTEIIVLGFQNMTGKITSYCLVSFNFLPRYTFERCYTVLGSDEFDLTSHGKP
jgi:hypothetical protein